MCIQAYCDKCAAAQARDACLYVYTVDYKAEVARLKLELQMEQDDYSELLSRNQVLAAQVEKLTKASQDASDLSVFLQARCNAAINDALHYQQMASEYESKYTALLHERNKTLWRL